MKTKEEIEQLAAREHWNSNIESRSYIQGYTQCQQDMSDKKYTEEDMRKAIDMAEKMTQEEGSISSSFIDKIIQSLNKQD